MQDDRNVLDYAPPPPKPPMSPARKALAINILLQIGELLLASIILDGGGYMQITMIVCAARWLGVYLIMARRRSCLTRLDVLFIRYGTLMLIPIAIPLAPFLHPTLNG